MAKQSSKRDAHCKVCNHDHVLDIEMMFLVQKLTSREVEAEIKRNGWKPFISYVTLLKHMREHVDDKRELFIKYVAGRQDIADTIEQAKLEGLDEQAIQLQALRLLDTSIMESSILQKMSSEAIQEQLSLRVETEAEAKKPGKPVQKVVGRDRKDPDKKRAYVPLQQVLVQLYKASAEEMRQTVKTKMDILGVDAQSRSAKAVETLADVVMARMAPNQDGEQEDRIPEMKLKNKKRKAG